MSVGSKNAALQQEGFGIFSTCIAKHIRVEPEWISCSKNQKADYLSDIVDYDDWQLHKLIHVYRFTSYYNPQLLHFGPMKPRLVMNLQPGHAELFKSIDAFTCDWGGLFN